jgi:hypothetical protein
LSVTEILSRASHDNRQPRRRRSSRVGRRFSPCSPCARHTLSLDATLAAHLNIAQDPIARLKNLAPWSMRQFVTALAICQSPWRLPSPELVGPTAAALLERMVDGIIMGCVMIAGFACALALIALFGLQRSTRRSLAIPSGSASSSVLS